MQRLAPAITVGGNFSVIPYVLVDDGATPLYTPQCTLRRHFLHELLASAPAPLALSEEEGVCPYLYAEEGKYVLILPNGNVDSFPEISLRLPHVSFSTVEWLGRDGKRTSVPFTRERDCVTFQTEIEYVSLPCCSCLDPCGEKRPARGYWARRIVGEGSFLHIFCRIPHGTFHARYDMI